MYGQLHFPLVIIPIILHICGRAPWEWCPPTSDNLNAALVAARAMN
jgi:hypothetical protein